MTQKGARVKPTQNELERSKPQTHKSAPAGQPMSDRDEELVFSLERLTETQPGKSARQSKPGNGRRLAIGIENGRRLAIGLENGRRPVIGSEKGWSPVIGPEVSIRSHTGDTPGQSVPVAGKKPDSGLERPSQTHRAQTTRNE